MTGVNIKVRADARQAQNEMRKLNASMQSIDKQAKNVTRTFQKLAIGITAALGGSAFARGITRASDSMTDFGNRVNLVTQDVAKTQVVMKELFNIAARSRGSVDAAAETFNRFGLALQDADKPLSELLIVTEAVQQAAVISGSGAESAKAAIVQLGQGLASGQLRGQELNSVLEQMPRLARAIADGMGIPFGKLREEAMAGQVTAEAVYAAILSGAEDIDKEFATLDATVGGLGIVLKNEFTRAISEMDKVLGFSAEIKTGILLATRAVRYFGENIGDWAFIVGSELLMAKAEVIFFTRDVEEAFKDLFSGNLDGSALADSFIEGLENLKVRATKKVEEVKEVVNGVFEDFTPEKIMPKAIDVSKNLFTGLNAAKTTISAFVTEIAGYFKGLWKSVVGNSYWTGIFDPSHEEGGAAAIGNVASWGKFLDAAAKRIEAWTGTLTAFFAKLHTNVTTQWANLVNYVNGLSFEAVDYNNLSSGFDSAIANMRTAWDDFSTYLTTKTLETPGGSEEVETNFGKGLRGVETLWDSIVENMSIRWDSFYDFLTTKEIDTPGGVVKVETEFGKTLGRMKAGYDSLFQTLFSSNQGTDYEVAAGLVPEASESELLTSLKGRIDSITAALAATPIFVAVKVLSEDLSENLTSIKDNIISFFKDNGPRMAAAITLSLTLGLNAYFRKDFLAKLLSFGIRGLFVAAAGILGNSQEFLAAARTTAFGFGDALNSILTDEGSGIVGTMLAGLGNLATAIGEGLLEGLFGTEFQDGFKSKLATAIGLAVTSFIIAPKITTGMAKIAGKLILSLATAMGAAKAFASFKGKFKSGLVAAFSDVESAPGKAGVAAKAVGSKLGSLSGKAMSAAMSGVLAKELSDVVIADDAFGGLGEALDGAIGGAIAGAQLGSPLGPLGVAIGAAVGGAVGGAFDVYNNPELKQKFADIAQAAKDWFLELPETVGTAVTSGFEMAWEYLAGKLATIKDFFNFDNPQTTDAIQNYSASDFGFATPQTPDGFSTGGAVNGPGTGTSDDIPAMLSNGEFVMRQSAVQKFGPGFMAKINAGVMPQMFNTGGLVDNTGGLASTVASLEAKHTKALSKAKTREDYRIASELFGRLQEARRRLEASEGLLDDGPGGSSSSDVSGSGSSSKTGKSKKSEAAEIGEDYAKQFQSDFNSGLKQLLRDGDVKGFLTGLLDSFTGGIIDSVVDGFTNSLFGKSAEEGGVLSNLFSGMFNFGSSVKSGVEKSTLDGVQQGGEGGFLSGITGFFGKMFKGIGDMFKGGGAGGGGGFLSGLLGMGGGGGLFSSIFGSSFGSFLGFSQGGIVPNTPFSQTGKDSVPAMLMPGEVVLSKNDVSRMDKSNQSSTQQFNINVSGDVSRQTRKEIVKMMPQIASGVNMNNKENNFRR